MSFGVESLDPGDAEEIGAAADSRRRISAQIIDHCRARGIVTAAFYVLGFLQDDWNSIAATIDYATDLGSTFAQFKILTPYPGTPMFKQLEPLLTRDRLGEVRRLHADVQPSQPDGPRAAVPARRGVHALLHAPVVPGELPEDPEHGRDGTGTVGRRARSDHAGRAERITRRTREEIADVLPVPS